MSKSRLDQTLAGLRLVASRSQAESFIKLGQVKVNGKVSTKPGTLVSKDDKIQLTAKEQYVSRAALKLDSATSKLGLDFRGKTILDVGSSTGGFTEYSLKHGAIKVIAVDVGTNQLHPSLVGNSKIELHEKTDIRDFKLSEPVDIILVDASFISLKELLPSIAKLMSKQTLLVAMAKPQFEAGGVVKHKGVIKNEKLRREVLKQLEIYLQQSFVIVGKADSDVTGSKGNRERFLLLKKITRTT